MRTGFGCNQDCGLCWQDREWGRYGAAQILVWIEDMHAAGARSLIISGGEPTLDAELERYLGRARALGFTAVTLETNAVQMAKHGVSERLRDAGMTDAFVSLHSGDEATSDAITRAPGTFARTLEGVRNLLAAGVPVGLNCVMTREGLDALHTLPDTIHQAFGGHPKLTGLMLSLPADPFDRSLLPSIIPDPVRLRALLRPLIDRAFSLGIQVKAIDGPCGPPLCAFGADRRITSLTPTPGEVPFRRHLPACDGCAVKHACFGARTAQLDLYGEACVEPLLVAP
ncbi:MAG: radical SAM protein [Byssovorax sp.]